MSDDDLIITLRPAPLERVPFSDLIEEILRREKQAKKTIQERFKPCDECQHFIAWEKNGDPPKEYNPCSKFHIMSFRTPDDYEDIASGEWGHHRQPCSNRKTRKPL